MYLETVRDDFINSINDALELSIGSEVNSEIVAFQIVNSILNIDEYHVELIPELLKVISDTLDINTAHAIENEAYGVDWLLLLKEMKIRGLRQITPTNSLYFYEFIIQGIVSEPGLSRLRYREWVLENIDWVESLYVRSREADLDD